jgi:hypothetical protein
MFIFCSCADVVKKLKEYVDNINANIEKLKTRGPVSKYVLPEENLRGRWEIFILVVLNPFLCFMSIVLIYLKCNKSNSFYSFADFQLSLMR